MSRPTVLVFYRALKVDQDCTAQVFVFYTDGDLDCPDYPLIFKMENQGWLPLDFLLMRISAGVAQG
jgi:hypothetical protein